MKGSREDAIRALINLWLKDNRMYCATCGEMFKGVQCCDNPVVGTNRAIFKQFNKEMKRIRQTRCNEHASISAGGMKDTMRWKLSIPIGLLQFLEKSFTIVYGEKLFNRDYNTNWFAKKFGKYFQVPERI